MEDKLFEALDDLNIKDTKLLLDKDIDLSIDSAARKRIEKSVMKKAGYYRERSERKNKINNIIRGILMKKKIALALSAGLVLSLAGGGYAYAKTPVAYVSMDINPSVELGVNAFDKVVSVEAYNEDGKNILEGTNLVNSKVEDAVKTVISNAISKKYIKEDGSSVIEITTSTNKTTGAAVELDESLKNVVDETLTNNDVQAEVQTENVALVRRDEARKLGITPGKLNLIQKLQALDSTITVEDYKNSSIKDIQKKTKELRKNTSTETTIEDSTTTNTSDGTTTNSTATNAVTSTETTTDADEAAIVETEKSNKSSNNKANNGNSKKEEVNVSQEQKSPEAAAEKQNKSGNSNSQGINSSSKEDKSSNIKADNNNSDSSSSKSENSNSSKGNSEKSDNGGSSNLNSQGKGKNK